MSTPDPATHRPGPAGQAEPLRVLVADDQELVRAGFRLILEAAGLAGVGEAPTGAAASGARGWLSALTWCLMDIRMPAGTAWRQPGSTPPQSRRPARAQGGDPYYLRPR